jgi:hypothetical protein
MNIKELIEQLQKLPTQTQLQDVKLKIGDRYGDGDLTDVVWQGSHVSLEAH